jgi:predicted ATPase
MLITHMRPRNFLSFGPDNPGLDLRPLNVLIGPNASGKSNLIEAISFMRAAPKEIRDVTSRGGGASEWIWKGNPQGASEVEWRLSIRDTRHRIVFASRNQAFMIEEEHLEQPGFVYRYEHGHASVVTDKGRRNLDLDGLRDRSILAQMLHDPETYLELFGTSETYKHIRIYREWSFGRSASLRQPQAADSRNDFLAEDFSNLAIFLSNLRTRFPAAKREILKGLQDLYEGLTDFEVLVTGGTVQVYFVEGDYSIPAARLSDGTLRYLCLLAILCDPEPPPLICIEEPELGLHPDILPNLADLLREASTRTQLIVTTHSDVLVDCMTETPESVVVCSKNEGQTTMERLNADNLSPWLDKYRLGQLWIEGEIGGTRW